MSKKKKLLRKQGKAVPPPPKKKKRIKVKVAPELPRPERPKLGELKDLYKAVMTADPGQKIASLASALQWYDKTMSWFTHKKPLSDDAAKMHVAILSVRRLCYTENTTNMLKIGYMVDALHHYQELFLNLKIQSLNIDDYLEKAEAAAPELQDEEQKLEDKYATVLGVLSAALKPVNAANKQVKIAVGKVKDAYIIDPELNRITFRKDVVKDMQHMLRRDGLLPLFKEVAEPLSRVAALEAEKDLEGHPTGRHHVNMRNQWQAFFKLWDNLIVFAQTEDAPKRLVKRPREIVAAPVNGHKTVTPRPHAFGGKRDTVPGNYKVGSAGAKLVTLMTDYQWHEKKEMAKAVAPRDVDDRIDSLKRRGLKYGLWSLEANGTQCRLVPLQQGGQA